MKSILFLRKYFFVLSVVFLASCDRDFNELNTDITNGDIHYGMSRYEASVVAYDKATGPVQSNNLPLNALGVYDNAVFGKTKAHFVSQLKLASVNPDFTDMVIDTVYLYVPYFSTAESIDENSNTTYSLDSIYGSAEGKIKLNIYENGYFLRDYDPNSSFTEVQKYYSDELPAVESYKRGAAADGTSVAGGERLNNDADVSQNDEFTFSSAEIIRKVALTSNPDEDIIAERLTPGIFTYLNKEFFQKKIFEAPSGQLLNDNTFRDYFRGLYFNVEQTGNQSAMGILNFSLGKIVIIYHDSTEDVEVDEPFTSKTFNITLTGNTVNFFENDYLSPFTDALADSNTTEGDEKLYIKGGAGSMGLLSILDTDDLDFLKYDEATGEKVLINEANLSFYIDKATMASGKEPDRIILYDLDNKRPIYDYYSDGTSSTLYPKYSKYVYGGIIEKDDDGKGIRYKIRVTNHINNVVNRDSTNVKLGLYVTENINLITNAALKSSFTFDGVEVKTLPAASVMHPFGTVLYGTNPAVPEDKRLKLEIFYTKPN